jgi:hypothetical protein
MSDLTPGGASSRKMETNRRAKAAGGTAKRIFTARSARTTRTPRPPIRKRGSTAKGQARRAKLCFPGRALMEHRNGLLVDACVTHG